MGFFLFLLVNATLFLRPSEIFPSLATFHIYEALILSCFACSFMSIVKQFTSAELEAAPITIGLLIVWMFCGVSLLMQLEVEAAADEMFHFFKIVVYYLLLVGLVNTPKRLRIFLASLGLFVAMLTMVAVLRYTEVIVVSVPTNDPKTDKKDDPTKPYVEDKYFDDKVGQEVILRRLRGTGIFHDPNDLCLALVMGVLISLWGILEPRLEMARIFCVLPLGLFLVALNMTYSRGGLLGLFAGLAVLFQARYGWRKSMILGAFALPILLVMFGGRITSFTVVEGTGQSRIQLWRDGLVELRTSPLFGVGMNHYALYAGQVAHNSYLNTFTELGFFGGATFLGMFYYAFWALRKVKHAHVIDDAMRRLLPFIMAIVAGFAVGILTLSRGYEVPTYTMLGLAAVYVRLAPVYAPVDLRISSSLIWQVLGASVGFLGFMYVLVRVVAA